MLKKKPIEPLWHQIPAIDAIKNGYVKSIETQHETRYMVLNLATGGGKTMILLFVYDELKKLDPNLKMVIATPQINLAQDIVNNFETHKNHKVLLLKGSVKQIEEIMDDPKRQKKAEEKCAAFIKESYALAGGKDREKQPNDFFRCMQEARRSKKVLDEAEKRNRDENNETIKNYMESSAKILRGEIGKNYKQAATIILKAIGKRAKDAVLASERGEADTSKEKKKEQKEKIRKLRREIFNEFLDDDILWLFPEFAYDKADVVVTTHAKAFSSLLSIRKMTLSNIDYEKEGGKHIVFVSDECEAGRSWCLDNEIDTAMDGDIDLLQFFNKMHASLAKSYFVNTDYDDIYDVFGGTDPGPENRKIVQDAAEKLLEDCEMFAKEYGYSFNMHMADVNLEDEAPKIAACNSYYISRGGRNHAVTTNSKNLTVSFVQRNEQAKNVKAFTSGIRHLIDEYTGLIRKAATILRMRRDTEEPLNDTIRSVASRVLEEKRSSADVRFVVSNAYRTHGHRNVENGEKHPYRSPLYCIKTAAGTATGRDVTLSHVGIPNFPEAVIEDIMSNVQFTILISGTGWLNALNNYNMSYLNRHGAEFKLDEKTRKEIHDRYIQWNAGQYKDTEIVPVRITGDIKNTVTNSGEEKSARDAECVCEFVKKHIQVMRDHGVNGGCGALIFPSASVKNNDTGAPFSIGNIMRKLGRQYRKDVVFMSMKSGTVYRYDERGNARQYDDVEQDGDTAVINVENGKFCYLITALRSGSRGYNIAFRNGNEKFDASGIMLFALTNIIPERKSEKDLNELSAEKRQSYDTERWLRISAIAIHNILLEEGIFERENVAKKTGMIRNIIEYDKARKDLYVTDICSPYKLQAVSETLQALGRIRNNKKQKAILIGIDDNIIKKDMFRPEQLQDEYLSYVAAEVKKKLPEIIVGYEAQKVEKELGKLSAHGYENLMKKCLPEAKEKARKGIKGWEEKLKGYITIIERFKDDAVSLGKSDKHIRQAWWEEEAVPYSLVSNRKKGEDGTVCTIIKETKENNPLDLTPEKAGLVQTLDLFSGFCREKLAEKLPVMMDKQVMEQMKATNRFPYAPTAECYDTMLGEFGERVFEAVMEEAFEQGLVDFTTKDLPEQQYEDFDTTLVRDGRIVAYANVKYWKRGGRNVEKRLKDDMEDNSKQYYRKLMAAGEDGMIPLIYINMRPMENRSIRMYTEENNVCIKTLNKHLKGDEKKTAVLTLSPFSVNDYTSTYDFMNNLQDMLRKMSSFIYGQNTGADM